MHVIYARTFANLVMILIIIFMFYEVLHGILSCLVQFQSKS